MGTSFGKKRAARMILESDCLDERVAGILNATKGIVSDSLDGGRFTSIAFSDTFFEGDLSNQIMKRYSFGIVKQTHPLKIRRVEPSKIYHEVY